MEKEKNIFQKAELSHMAFFKRKASQRYAMVHILIIVQ